MLLFYIFIYYKAECRNNSRIKLCTGKLLYLFQGLPWKLTLTIRPVCNHGIICVCYRYYPGTQRHTLCFIQLTAIFVGIEIFMMGKDNGDSLTQYIPYLRQDIRPSLGMFTHNLPLIFCKGCRLSYQIHADIYLTYIMKETGNSDILTLFPCTSPRHCNIHSDF